MDSESAVPAPRLEPPSGAQGLLTLPKGTEGDQLSLPSSDGSDGSTGPSDGPAGRIQYEVGGAGLLEEPTSRTGRTSGGTEDQRGNWRPNWR